MRPAERLRKGREFDSVYERGTTAVGPLFVVRRIDITDGRPGRWGFAVGKRMVPGSPERNRIRRRMRVAASTLGDAVHADIVVTARARSRSASVDEMAAALRRQLHAGGGGSQ